MTLRMRTLLIVAGVAVCVSTAVSPAFAAVSPNDPSSGGLVDAPKTYDGKRVTFTGEAIGEVMKRGGNAWLHLNDDAYMLRNVEEGEPLGGYNSGMPVWLPYELSEKVRTYGDYKRQGDVVRVDGVFNAACRLHGGDMDIHADALEVVQPGRRALDPIQPWKVWLAIGLGVVAVGMWWGDRRASVNELFGSPRKHRGARAPDA